MTTRGTLHGRRPASAEVVRLTPPSVRLRRRASDACAGSPPLAPGVRMADRQLLRAVALGDESAWCRLVDAYVPLVWALSLQAAGELAEAVCELVWLRLAQDPPTLIGLDLERWLRLAVVQAAREAAAIVLPVTSGNGTPGDHP